MEPGHYVLLVGLKSGHFSYQLELLLLLVCLFLLQFLFQNSRLLGHLAELLEDFVNVEALGGDLFEISHHFLVTVTEKKDLWRLSQELELMSNQDDALLSQGCLNGLLKDSIGDCRVHCGERVIQQVDVSVLVDGARQTNPSLLTARDVDTALPNHSVPAVRELLIVAHKLGRFHRLAEATFSILKAETNG